MSDYHSTGELLDVPFGFNLPFDENIAELTIQRLSAENARLKLQVKELQDKISRLIDESDEGIEE